MSETRGGRSWDAGIKFNTCSRLKMFKGAMKTLVTLANLVESNQ